MDAVPFTHALPHTQPLYLVAECIKEANEDGRSEAVLRQPFDQLVDINLGAMLYELNVKH